MSDLKYLKSRYGVFPVQYVSGEVRWPHWDLLYIHSGEILIKTGKKNEPLRQEEAVIIPPGYSFSIRNRGTAATASVQYFLPYEGSAISRRLVSVKNPFFIVNREDLNISSHIRELMGIGISGEVSRRQELLLELIIEKAMLIRSGIKKKQNQWDILIDKYRERPYEIPSMEKLAEEAGYSPGRFRTLFQDHIGLSPARFFLNDRMERGARLLIETTKPIKEIAYECGYGNVSHFNRAFTNQYSITPARYRRENLLRG